MPRNLRYLNCYIFKNTLKKKKNFLISNETGTQILTFTTVFAYFGKTFLKFKASTKKHIYTKVNFQKRKNDSDCKSKPSRGEFLFFLKNTQKILKYATINIIEYRPIRK